MEAHQAPEGEDHRVKKHPWFKFFPSDWRADASLRMCSPAARLLWLEMLCLMHEADPRGYLLVKGRVPSADQLGMLSGITGGIVPELLSELREADVYSIDPDGVIYSRKMVNDTKVSEDQSARVQKRWEKETAGNTGGNTGSIPKKPEARSQKVADGGEPISGDDWPAGKPLDHASLIVSEANTVYLDTAREPGLIQTLGRLHAWRRDGASWQHDILPVITTMAGKLSRPVKSWAYFDAAIGESIAANRRALTIPEHDHVNRPDPARPASGHDSRRRGALEALDLLEGGDAGREGGDGPDQG